MTTELTPDVPGIIPYFPEEVDEFDTLIARVRVKDLDDKEFTGHRLLRGVYGQRQPDRQMVRIKIPLGRLDARQMEVLADVIEQFAPLGHGHFTTRENMQLHHVPLDGTPTLMRMLGKVGITTREACGNTVRNVTGCALAGVCPDEQFDASPYAAAYARYLVRRDFAMKMPRKVKTAFVACREDHAVIRIHDIGFVGSVRQISGQPVRGFRIVVGGGTSIEPVLAPELYEFVTADDGAYLRVSEAVLRVFNRSDELRKNRMKARIKILIKRIGIDAFRELVEKELTEPWAKLPIDVPALSAGLPREGKIPAAAPFERPPETNAAFAEWLRTNAVPQKQAGYHGAFVTIPTGDVTPAQCRGLAAIARAHGTGEIRVTYDQNVVIRWVPGGRLHGVWSDLAAIGLGAPGAQRVTDVVSCPGTDSCKLGITSSMGLNRAVRSMLASRPDLTRDPLIDRMHIRISGCPNGCGQHHIGDIGFHGAAAKGDQKMYVPAYEAFIGGMYQGSLVRYGIRPKGKIPAKSLPDAIAEMLTWYRDQRHAEEQFSAFVDRVGTAPFEAIVSKFGDIPTFDAKAPAFYQDWERTALYKVERGEGECAM
ncbi:MAG: nitrite/sulfite reductase [Gemmatimonadetes bacterium]|nr:nitrite/sulfite reductase [Gemmatimonadota bacterium]